MTHLPDSDLRELEGLEAHLQQVADNQRGNLKWCREHREIWQDPNDDAPLAESIASHDRWAKAVSSLIADLREMRERIGEFLTKFDECDPHITAAFQMAYTVRGHQYTGPNYAAELAALRNLLPAPAKADAILAAEAAQSLRAQEIFEEALNEVETDPGLGEYIDFCAGEPTMTDDQIKHMVNRFLMWRLPEDFRPDAGISFKPDYNEGTSWPMKHEPVGTNLFDATQTDAMVRYMIDGLPAKADAILASDGGRETKCYECGHELSGPYCPACNSADGGREMVRALIEACEPLAVIPRTLTIENLDRLSAAHAKAKEWLEGKG